MRTTRLTSGSIAPKAYAIAILLVALLAPRVTPLSAASVKVGGFGLFGNAELRGALQLLEFGDGPLDARKIDDGAFLLLTRLTQNGFLDASLSASYVTPDGQTGTATWTSPFEPQIGEGVIADKLHYEIESGLLYHYRNVNIEGLASIGEDEARTYLIPDGALYSRNKDRSYSASILNNHQKQLAAALSALGRTDAKVSATDIEIDNTSGDVDVTLLVDEGPLYKIVSTETQFLDGHQVMDTQSNEVNAIYTRNWIEDQTRHLRNESYRLGYPDTKVSSRVLKASPEDGAVAVSIRFEVQRGPKIILSSIEHSGATDTHLPLLTRKSDLETGGPLDITETEAARRRLSQLGIFERIDLRYEDDGPGRRKAVYEYKNGERIEGQLLFGYGSYEQFRAGFLSRRDNLFGRAHTLSFSAIRSIKSTTGRLDYTIPELLGESIDGTFEINFLDREELYFDRTERGISLGLAKRLPELNLDLGFDYALDRKRSSDPQFNTALRIEDTNIGSVSFRASRNTLDNILYPTAGHELNGAVRYAAKGLGGQTEFIRSEVSAAYHSRFGQRWIFHLGAKGGIISSPGDNATEIPNGERFLVGGENSIRGYRRGEASPVDTNGIPVGAEAYLLLNAELEYPIFHKLNLVLFSDTTRVWDSSGRFDEFDDLSSVGLGFRYNTIIGPVRLEYGHNLDPRPDDPRGTLHLSVGFPF